MSSVDNRLEESISNFSSKAGVCTTRSQCDAFASKTFGGPVKPFRDPDSPLDKELLAIVKNTHPDFVASCSFHGTIGSSPALLIYSMNMLPGDNYFNISLSMLDADLERQLATVRSLARFFAQSWQNSSQLDPNTVSAIFKNCFSSFDYLSSNLPFHFQKTVTRVQEVLPTLFYGKYPLVVTPGDLSEMNILANPETGEITGIIDWAEAGIQPFGFALYALDNILGYLTLNRWVFYGSFEYLRDEFWRIFCELVGGVSKSEMELIQLARLAGLFLRYGIPDEPGRKGVVGVGGEDNSSMMVLEALIPG
ncbi:hypothetical protein AJ80_07015 [Polytolypa hystricis UAMH7299]|uniref:Aminoglycoside phosphotransferase domain-containing protein n=1 Tax=Polytolypa hystricis (strain UAMH7299) TaxID=1447883 RepID=A0A2B7XJ42_POLH7|nr:hypothetical protein AJ80_07015 [Polytolypa hystricis UAMH7299]